jgi:hypothetical protein
MKELKSIAREIGFLVMLKASVGGGGSKGMRIVIEASKLKEELTRAQSEAVRSFGLRIALWRSTLRLQNTSKFRSLVTCAGRLSLCGNVSVWYKGDSRKSLRKHPHRG